MAPCTTLSAQSEIATLQGPETFETLHLLCAESSLIVTVVYAVPPSDTPPHPEPPLVLGDSSRIPVAVPDAVAFRPRASVTATVAVKL
jgi:hypothetical protein